MFNLPESTMKTDKEGITEDDPIITTTSKLDTNGWYYVAFLQVSVIFIPECSSATNKISH